MQANLAHYCTYAVAEQFELMLPNYRSELGNAQTVPVAREWTEQPAKAPPDIWVDTKLTAMQSQPFVGDDTGNDGSGNPQFGIVLDGVPVDFGVRALKPAEVDNLFDFLCLLRWAVNPATNVRWAQEFYQRRGVEILDMVPTTKRQTRASQFGGTLYEIEGQAVIRTAVSVNVVYQPLTSIVILPTADVWVPVQLSAD